MELPQFSKHPGCMACDLHEGKKNVGIASRWLDWTLPPSRETPAVFYLGQNPGFDEDQVGLPFIGMSGRLTALAYVGMIYNGSDTRYQGMELGPGIFKRATCYVGNTARCGTWGSIQPKARHYRQCIPFLTDDLFKIAATCQRLIVVNLGAPAAYHFYEHYLDGGLKQGNAVQRGGELVTIKDTQLTFDRPVQRTLDVQVYSTYHPAFVMRKNAVIHEIIDRLHLVVDSLDGISPVPSRPTMVAPRYPDWAVEATFSITRSKDPLHATS